MSAKISATTSATTFYSIGDYVTAKSSRDEFPIKADETYIVRHAKMTGVMETYYLENFATGGTFWVTLPNTLDLLLPA